MGRANGTAQTTIMLDSVSSRLAAAMCGEEGSTRGYDMLGRLVVKTGRDSQTTVSARRAVDGAIVLLREKPADRVKPVGELIRRELSVLRENQLAEISSALEGLELPGAKT